VLNWVQICKLRCCGAQWSGVLWLSVSFAHGCPSCSDTGSSDTGSGVDETIDTVGGIAQDFACWLFGC
jgi:hypothetical protein